MCEFSRIASSYLVEGVNSRMGYVWCQLQLFTLCALLSLSDQTEVVACLSRLLVLLPLSPPPLYFGRWCRKQASRFCLPGSALTLFWVMLYVQSNRFEVRRRQLGNPSGLAGQGYGAIAYLQDSQSNLHLIRSWILFCFRCHLYLCIVSFVS